MKLLSRLKPFATLLMILCFSVFVHAQEASQDQVENEVRKREKRACAIRKEPHKATEETLPLDNFQRPWWQWEHATGDWRDRRPWLEEQGITLQLTHIGEAFSNIRGGRNTSDATVYRGTVDFTLTIDTGNLGLWPDGIFFIYGQNAHGQGLTEEHVDDLQTLSNIDARDLTQLSGYWYEQLLFAEQLRLKVGKQDANVDFCALDFGADFINSSFGLIPTVPMPTFPNPGLGIVAFLMPKDWLTLGSGIYDGAPDGGSLGFDTAFDAESGTFSILEFTLSPSVQYGGSYRLGVWNHTDDVEAIAIDGNRDSFSSNYGFYLAFDQPIYRKSKDNEQGLGVFIQFGWAPDDRNEISRYFGAGLAYNGVLPVYGQDVVGIGVAYAQLSERLEEIDGRTHETAVEFFYKVGFTPWFSLQPDVQYIINPGGNGEDALAAGLRFEFDF